MKAGTLNFATNNPFTKPGTSPKINATVMPMGIDRIWDAPAAINTERSSIMKDIVLRFREFEVLGSHGIGT